VLPALPVLPVLPTLPVFPVFPVFPGLLLPLRLDPVPPVFPGLPELPPGGEPRRSLPLLDDDPLEPMRLSSGEPLELPDLRPELPELLDPLIPLRSRLMSSPCPDLPLVFGMLPSSIQRYQSNLRGEGLRSH
jgi:hypothetical protein